MDANLECKQAKMILKALKDGWTVRMNDKDEFEFTKDKRHMTHIEKSEVTADGYSDKFLRSLWSEERGTK